MLDVEPESLSLKQAKFIANNNSQFVIAREILEQAINLEETGTINPLFKNYPLKEKYDEFVKNIKFLLSDSERKFNLWLLGRNNSQNDSIEYPIDLEIEAINIETDKKQNSDS